MGNNLNPAPISFFHPPETLINRIHLMKKLSSCTIGLAALLLTSCGGNSTGNQQNQSSEITPQLTAEGEFPIIAWYGVPADHTNLTRYRELRDCGFTHNFTEHYANADSMASALDIARQCGLKLIINTPNLRDEPEQIAERFKNHPAIAGYYVRDEPSMRDFKHLGEITSRIQNVDSTHFCYINLLPSHAPEGMLGTTDYRQYVHSFDSITGVQLLTYDHYPILEDEKGLTLRPEYFHNIEMFSDEARKAGKPFWAFALTTAHGPYPVPDMAQLRLQVFTDLAYGAQGIQYFTYWDPKVDEVDFHHAPIDRNNRRTDVWDKVKAMNSEIKGLSGVFLGCQVTSVNHTGTEIPNGTKRLETLPEGFSKLDTHGCGAIVSQIKNGDNRFVVIVNRSLTARMTLTTEVADTMKRVLKDGSIVPASTYANEIFVEPGDAVVFMH